MMSYKKQLTTASGHLAEMVVKEDGVVENGDTVNIDFSGSVDGEEFEGGQAEGYDLEIGSGSFIPGFERAIRRYES